ncbi:hypothetical protein KIPB_007461, partial [Kipferlia bialata]
THTAGLVTRVHVWAPHMGYGYISIHQ